MFPLSRVSEASRTFSSVDTRKADSKINTVRVPVLCISVTFAVSHFFDLLTENSIRGAGLRFALIHTFSAVRDKIFGTHIASSCFLFTEYSVRLPLSLLPPPLICDSFAVVSVIPEYANGICYYCYAAPPPPLLPVLLIMDDKLIFHVFVYRTL